MAATDPRTTIKGIIDTYITANPLTKDGGANATTISLWESGPERLKYLFLTYDVILTFGNPTSRSTRPIQDAPVHYVMSYPVTVTTVDKLTAGVVVCTAARMLYKAAYAIRRALELSAQSAPGAVPVWTLKEDTDREKHTLLGGLDIWESVHTVEYLKGGV